RRLGVDGIDELDRGLVDARGERHRHRRLGRPRSSLHDRLRAALDASRRPAQRQGRHRPDLGVRHRSSAVVLPRPGGAARTPDRQGDRHRDAACAHRVARPLVRPHPRNARPGRHRWKGRRRRRRRPHPGARSAAPVARERERVVEGAAPADRARARAVLGEALDAVRPRLRTRLHAREGDGRGRRRLRRQLQPLAFGRAQRRERARDRRRGARRATGRIHRRSTREVSGGRPRMMRRALIRRRFLVAALSLVGALTTFVVVVVTDSSSLTGAIVFAPWVMLIGVDSGVIPGVVAGGGAGALWMAGAAMDSTHPSTSQIILRVGVLCVLGFGSGIVGNQLRTSERARATTVARQRALIDATIDGICLTDVDGNILIVNEPLVRMATDLEMPTEGTVVERLLAVADKLADPERYRQRMLEIADSPGQATTDEFELQGTGRVFRGYTSPVNDRRGRPVGRIWTLREVTADKELERLHHLVEDLLLVAQIEARRVDLQHEPIDLAAVAERAVEAVRPWASEKQVRIELSTNDVPTILGDERRLAQVLDNLLSNAVKFSGDGEVVEVAVEKNDGGEARIVVADHGIGIPADEQGHVFSRFYRARAANELAVPGTGLGLAITRALVDQHGGTIDLESREGEGTTVTVHLPTA